ncbi:TPA: threonine synthase [bacterium]|nr:threonine synthase [bacterium]
MGYVIALKCKECGREYPKEAIFACEFCFGPLEVVYDYKEIKKRISRSSIEESKIYSLWRYKELLPIDGEAQDGLHSGFTPLIKAKNLAKVLGVDELYIKDDSVNHPTLSFKDRVVSVALSRAKELGFTTVACASTGNLANSVSALGAMANFKRFIFIPADLETSKVVGSLVYNPIVVGVKGNYDQVNRLCSEIADKYKWAFVNINIRPYYAEGSKTLGYEIAEQLGWKLPKHIVIPCASGSLLTKIYKGMKEFEMLGLIEHLDIKIYAAQPDGCSPIVSAIFEDTSFIKPQIPKTIAKSLAIGNPADGYYAYKVVKETGGYGDVASDSEIVSGIKLLAETEGIFSETAGGVTVTVCKKLIEKGRIPRDESIVICITGQGLKTQEAVIGKIGTLIIIEPNLRSFEKEVRPDD